MWVARVLWVLVGASGAYAITDAIDGRSTAVRIVATAQLWVTFGVVLTALVVPSTVSLTIVRVAAPFAVMSMVVTWSSGAEAVIGVVAIAVATLNAVFIAGGDVGQAFVQASAYGDERRYPLRPPVGFLAPVVVSWCVWGVATLAGPLLLGARQWLAGAIVTAIAIGLTWWLAPRYHRLSRRWLVLAPAGVVVHDQVVLAETGMVQRSNVAGMRLAPADTAAADLTGPAAGHALEVSLRDQMTVVLAATRRKPKGAALHVRSFLVAPTRPGRALQGADDRQLPVG